jgi:hypothetical protein
VKQGFPMAMLLAQAQKELDDRLLLLLLGEAIGRILILT